MLQSVLGKASVIKQFKSVDCFQQFENTKIKLLTTMANQDVSMINYHR